MSAIKKTENLRADIVVIGGGGAGLPAAVAAAEAGAKNVIVLEKASRPGGNAAMSGGIFAIDSPFQKRLGIEVSASEVFKGLMEYSNWKLDPKVVSAFITQSGDIIRWLEDMGLKFHSITEMTSGAPKTLHIFLSGYAGDQDLEKRRALVDVLTESCQDLGVQVFLKTVAEKIITDEKGEVSGVLAKIKGKELKIRSLFPLLYTMVGGRGLEPLTPCV